MEDAKCVEIVDNKIKDEIVKNMGIIHTDAHWGNLDEKEKELEELSNGCGEKGLYDCPIHPELDKIRNQALHKTITKNFSLDHVPTDYLINEIKNRQLAQPLTGEVEINTNNTVGFVIDKLTWPVGKYNVSINFISETNSKETEEAKNNTPVKDNSVKG